MHPFAENNYINKTFSHLSFEDGRIEHLVFENCQFKQCTFTGVTFSKVRFTDCDFESCNLSLVKFPGCKFLDVVFKNTRLAGINWTEISWPQVKLTSPLSFYSCNISHSSFYSLDLADFIVEECKAHDVDFRESNLSHASFNGSDLLNSLFLHTNLKAADFTQAINYSIDPNTNTITHARFSFPEAMALLNCFNIKIE